ncbi:homeobox-domain-containing protein [Pilatotrama ljubarskyi]|nr:homeobox-domain-containing protein [Pilatotrama ljubarskyi]
MGREPQHAAHRNPSDSPRATLQSLDTRGLSFHDSRASLGTPTSSVLSPLSAGLSPACSDVVSSVEGGENEGESSPPTLRRAMSLSALTAEAKQRRKRSRTTPEQLAKLEEYFAADQSPTSARRREIARELGLDERQTQIWFQNRRAKVKLLAKRKARAEERLEPHPENPSPSGSGLDAEILSLVHEEEDITIIPCTDLRIGAWRRVASPHHTLVAYVCEARRCVTWFIRSEGLSFKMEVPFDIIIGSRFLNVSPGVGSATFLLDRPPTFYVEKLADQALGIGSPRYWHVSGDWTEGRQASVVFQHCLVGPAHQLWHLVNSISPSRTPSEASLSTPTPSISDVGSSPEVYARSCESPVEGHPQMSSMVLRRPSSLSSLRILHHPSLERLRPSRPTSVPMFHYPVSSLPTPSPLHPLDEAQAKPSSAHIYVSNSQPRQYIAPPHGGVAERLPRLPLAMPNFPRLSYDYDSHSMSPHAGASEPPSSAASTPDYYNAPSPVWESPFIPQGGSPGPERPQESYYPRTHGPPVPPYHHDSGDG